MRLSSLKTPGLLVAASLVVTACADPVGLTLLGAGSGVAMGAGVDYTLNGIAYKTFPASLQDARSATLDSLRGLDMKVTEDGKNNDGGWTIAAVAQGRSIEIDLSALSAHATSEKVIASDGLFFKDRATEALILEKTDEALAGVSRRARVAAKSVRRQPGE